MKVHKLLDPVVYKYIVQGHSNFYNFYSYRIPDLEGLYILRHVRYSEFSNVRTIVSRITYRDDIYTCMTEGAQEPITAFESDVKDPKVYSNQGIIATDGRMLYNTEILIGQVLNGPIGLTIELGLQKVDTEFPEPQTICHRDRNKLMCNYVHNIQPTAFVKNQLLGLYSELRKFDDYVPIILAKFNVPLEVSEHICKHLDYEFLRSVA